jgi:hypothetical protein
MKKLQRGLLRISGFAVASGLALACSRRILATATPPPEQSDLEDAGRGPPEPGSLELALTVPAALAKQRTGINYVVINNLEDGATTPGYTVVDALTSDVFVGGLTPGPHYEIQLSATDGNGNGCAAATTFSVLADAISLADVTLICASTDAGSFTADASVRSPCGGAVCVDAGITFGLPTCPGISAFSYTPVGLPVGQSSQFSAVGVGAASVVAWTQTGDGAGKFGSPAALSTSFTCERAGTVAVTVTASLPDSGACEGYKFSAFTANVFCDTKALDAGLDSDSAAAP